MGRESGCGERLSLTMATLTNSGITMGSHVSHFAIPRGLSIEDPDGTRRIVFTFCVASTVANLILLQNLRPRGY